MGAPKSASRNRHMLSGVSSSLPKTIKKKDKESIMRGVIGYVQQLQKQLKDVRADIALLQSKKSKTDHNNNALSATVQNTFDTYDMNNNVKQPYENEGCGYGDDEDVRQKMAETEYDKYDIRSNMLQGLHVKEVKEKMFHIEIRCKREARVLQRLTKSLESLQLRMDFHSANIKAVDSCFINSVLIKTRAPMKAEILKQVIVDAALHMPNPKMKASHSVLDICKQKPF